MTERQSLPGRVFTALGVSDERKSSARGLVERAALLSGRFLPLWPRCQPLADGSLRVYCYHIRKTGGTSLHRSFLSLGGEDPADVERRLAGSFVHQTLSGGRVYAAGKRAAEAGLYFYAFSHLPATELRLRPRTFTITILRDPLARVVSLYSYLRRGDDLDMVFKAAEEEGIAAAGGFERFLENLPREQVLGQLRMFSRAMNVDEAVEAVNRCSFWVMNDELDSRLPELSSILGVNLAPRHDRVTGSSKAELRPATRGLLREMLEPEYEMLRRLGAKLD